MILIETKKSSRRTLETPFGGVIHYSAGRPRAPGGMLKAMQSWALDSRASSTDFMIGRDPSSEETCRMVRRGAREWSWYHWHCGGSSWPAGGPWRDRTNEALVGIDLDNYGWLQLCGGVWCCRRADYTAPKSKDYAWKAGDKPFLRPVYVDAKGCGWEAYPEAQIEELVKVLKLVWPQTQQRALVGHENIRSTKSDPGRAFDQWWPVVRSELGISG